MGSDRAGGQKRTKRGPWRDRGPLDRCSTPEPGRGAVGGVCRRNVEFLRIALRFAPQPIMNRRSGGLGCGEVSVAIAPAPPGLAPSGSVDHPSVNLSHRPGPVGGRWGQFCDRPKDSPWSRLELVNGWHSSMGSERSAGSTANAEGLNAVGQGKGCLLAQPPFAFAPSNGRLEGDAAPRRARS